MPKKRRSLNTSSDIYYSPDKKNKDNVKDNDVVWMARGRLKGALQDALDPNLDADSSNENIPVKMEKNTDLRDGKLSLSARKDFSEFSGDNDDDVSDKSDKKVSCRKRLLSPNRSNSYVMKLFDRSVDLAQFKEDTPLYPICRAWMANQPRNSFRPKSPEPEFDDNSFCKIDLPPPEGPLVPRVPPLLSDQLHCGKLNINFNYNEMTPPSIDVLLDMHKTRWSAIRRNWFEQSIKYEGRYAETQEMLKEMDTNS